MTVPQTLFPVPPPSTSAFPIICREEEPVRELAVLAPVFVCRVNVFSCKWKGVTLPFTLRAPDDPTDVSLPEKRGKGKAAWCAVCSCHHVTGK